ncbi:class I SAM-dependent methyltransferase [Maribacter algarum]|uniref:Class I SAM-dependent methyltransferase n=1 Tax=Maribacter algarum (ex Zhang et al. 2020) TaxID=2578118 RepID=A0A5S3PQX4_9FLAO|nr:class I SAM-dependent methyltransferase [Maribacter algarum]TMM57112.1 class I SAM-dependent methyltransferase [Maribacter algarum]
MKTDAKDLKLLPLTSLIKTGEVDHADWNYRPVLGTISCSRFRLVKKMLVEKHGERLLEIGYGSGVFLPELANHADKVYGVDIHEKTAEVAERLLEVNVDAELVSGGAEKMKWENNSFDFVVAVSALEFVSDLDAVCREVKRILKPNGSFMVVTPGKSPLLDFGLKVLTGKSAKEDFADRREIILPTLLKHFSTKQKLTYPRHGASLVKLYTALELTPLAD